MFVRTGPLIAAAALAACSSSNRETRTAENQAGASQSGPTATAQGTLVRENPATGSSTDAASNSPAGASGTTTSTRAAVEAPNAPAASGMSSGSMGSSSSMSSASGKVASVDPDAGSITLDQAANPAIIVIVDENTRFVAPGGQAMSEGISGIHEGQQVRASLDPNSHHADQIQVTKEEKANKSRRQQQDQELLQDKPKQ
jgi:hypothetical protein